MLINIFIALTYTTIHSMRLLTFIYTCMHSHSRYYQCGLNRWSKCSFNYVNYSSVNIVSCAFTATDIMLLRIRGEFHSLSTVSYISPIRIGIIIFFIFLQNSIQRICRKFFKKNRRKYINIILHLYKRNELRIRVVSVFAPSRDLRKCFTLEDGSFYCLFAIDIVLLVSFSVVVHFSIRAKEHETDWKGQKFLFLCTERIYQISDASVNFPWDHVA